jgi:hypothetical protein
VFDPSGKSPILSPRIVALSGSYALAALLLLTAGAAKAVRPDPVVRALRGLGFPIGGWTVRLGAVAESLLGAAALISSSWPITVLVAISFLAFAAFIVAALRRPNLVSSCGCFGGEESPPMLIHLVVDLVLVGFTVAASAHGVVALRAFVAHHPMLSVPFLVLISVTTWFVYLSMTALPQLASELRRGDRSQL